MRAIIDDINSILQRHGLEADISDDDLTITASTVSDHVKPVSRLSELLVEHLWPRIQTATVFHFTSREAAESIISTNTFRLQNIAKRFSEGEISKFCESHKLNGYLELDAEGNPKYKSLVMPQVFYSSFTEEALTCTQQESFWRNFAAVDGVRLTMKIEASNPNFRRIRYERVNGKPIPILFDLTTELWSRHNRRFILSGISRLCAFYLSGESYGWEKEYRLLYKAWKEIGPQPTGDGPSSYIEIPLGIMDDTGYKLEVVDVCSNTKPAMPSSVPFTQRVA